MLTSLTQWESDNLLGVHFSIFCIQPDFYHRHVSHRLGGPPFRCVHWRHMDTHSGLASYQLSKTTGHSPGHVFFSPPPTWLFFGNPAVSYVKWQGGTVSRSLCKLTLNFWTLSVAHQIFPSAAHVPGVQNATTDALSIIGPLVHKWELKDHFLLPLFLSWGHPNWDVFDTRES